MAKATLKKATKEPAELTRQVEALKQAKARREEELKRKQANPEPEEQTLITDTRSCAGCSVNFESSAVVINGVEFCRKLYCDSCIELRDFEEEEDRKQKLAASRKAAFEDRWARICPPRYAEPFDIEKAVASIRNERQEFWRKVGKMKNEPPRTWKEEDDQRLREAIDKVLNYPYSERGLGLVGASGHAKTRLVFSLIHRYLSENRPCKYINLAVFGRELGARFSQSAKDGNDWINGFCKTPVLFLDDVGKEKMTERVETELYGIIEVRSANLLPIYFTANSGGEKLIEKMVDDTGEVSDRAVPIVRRLREFCEGITI